MARGSSPTSTRASSRSSQTASRPSTQQNSSRRSKKHDSDGPRITHRDTKTNRFLPVHLDLTRGGKKRGTLTLDNTGHLRMNSPKHRVAQIDSSATTDASSRQSTHSQQSASRSAANSDAGGHRRAHIRVQPPSSLRRTTVKASQSSGTTHVYRAELGDVLFDHDVATDVSGEDDQHERLVAFWRVSARASQMQVPVTSVAVGVDGIDFFVSHVWQPPTTPCTLDLEKYAMQKVETLTQFCISQAALAAASCSSVDEAPWFLRDPATLQDNEEEDPDDDPRHAWRAWQCWVDKACAVTPGSAAEVTPNSNELVRTTKAALRSSRTFLAVLTWQYFSRLWCVFEWAAFVTRVAPHYRQIELVIPEVCITEGMWPQFINIASSFSLARLHTGSESDHPQLWRELEQIIVSTEGFERFMQATALALLARYALLLCTKQCPAFSATMTANAQSNLEPLRLEPLVEACNKLGMHSLADALHSAKPRGWWNLALRRAREKKKNTQIQEESEAKIYTAIEHESRDDPMERLWRALNQRVNAKQKKEESTSQKNQVSDSAQAATYAMQMISKQTEIQDAVLGFSGSATEIKKRLTAKQLQSKTELLTHEEVDDEDSMDADEEDLSQVASSAGSQVDKQVDKGPERDWLQDFKRASEGDAAAVLGDEIMLGSSLKEILHTSEGRASVNPQLRNQLAPAVETEVPKGFQDMRQDTGVAKTLFGGLPDGLGPFWRGVKGKHLSEGERVRAKVFRNAWIGYREMVDKWFDKHVCPKLEVWRQRGIRISSLLDETFGSSFLPVSGALQDVLCDALTPKAREMFLAREPPPRGRPARCFDAPWDNPALNRLILMGKHLDAEKEGDIKKAPVLLISSLPLKMTPAPRHNLLCVRLVETNEWKHVAVPQSLGAEALTNALRHLFEDKHITKLELEVIVPRLALKVRGLEGFESMRVVLGGHIFGVLRHFRRRKATLFHKAHEVSLRAASPTSVGMDEDDGDGADSLGWSRWKCSHTRRIAGDDSSQSSDDEAPENLGKPGSDDVDTFHPRHRIATESGQGGFGALEPVRVSTPRRAKANGDAGQLAFQKARESIMGFSKAEASIAAGCQPPKRNRRVMGAGGLLPHSAVLAVMRPPDLSKVDLVTVTRHVERPRPRSNERLPQLYLDANFRHTPAGPESKPSSPRAHSAGASEHKDLDNKSPGEMAQVSPTGFLGQYLAQRQNWQWTAHAYGGAAMENFKWSGTFRDVFSQVQRWTNEGTCHQWMPVDHIAQGHGRAFTTKDEDTVTVQPRKRGGNSRNTEGARSDLGKCVQGPQCSFCGHTDVVTVMLDRSMLSQVWAVPACRVCLTCSNVEKVESASGPATTFDGDTVLEVCTAVLLRAGTASSFQQLAARVLRVDSEQVLVAAPAEDVNKAATSAKSRVAHISLCARSTGTSAAVVTASRYTKHGIPDDGGSFIRDHDWVHTCLRDTGLDLKYGEDRPVAIDQAIGELDDRRTLPRRVDVSPLVLWVELRHVLSEDFDAFEWCRASLELLGRGKFSLVAAVTMRQNSEKLRKTLGMQTIDGAPGAKTKHDKKGQGQEVHDEPVHWPLALHRAFFTENGGEEELLGAALNGAGLQVGGPTQLIEQGINLIAELHSDTASGSNRETKQFSSAVKAAGAWRSSLLKDSRGSLNKNEDAGDASPRQATKSTKSGSVMFHGLLNDVADEVAHVPRDNRGRRMTLTNIGRRALDPAAVMRNLTYRRNMRGGDLGAEARALLRARRLLRLMQVSSFLTKLHERVTANDEWRFSSSSDVLNSERESGSEGSSVEEDEDEDEGAKSDSTESAHKEPTKSVEELTVQKVLGHAKEYVHHGDIVLKCLQVLNIIVQTCSTFLANASNLAGRGRRRGPNSRKAEAPPIERVALEQDFSRTALRALYRHWKRPEIGAEALKLLTHVLSGELQEDIYNRLCAELSSPPERVLTLIMAAGKFSEGLDLDQLRSTMKVLTAVATWREPVPSVPVEREDEAASILMSIMFEHEEEGDIFEMCTQLVNLFLNDQPLCEAFFGQGLGTPVRSWLTKSAQGEVTSLWRSAVEEQTKDVKIGHSGIGAMHLRKRMSRINAVPVRVGRCEKFAWQILGKLTQGGGELEGFAEESAATIQHGVEELRRLPRTSQWSMALSCLSDLVLNSGEALAGLFIQTGGLDLMLDEVPEGEVANVLPLILGLLTVEGQGPEPDKIPGETDDEDEAREMASAKERQMERRDSKQDLREQRRVSRRISRGEELDESQLRMLQDRESGKELLMRQSSSWMDREQNPEGQEGSEHHRSRRSVSSGLAIKARTFFTKHHAVTKCLDALVKYRRWPEIQTQLFDILAELFRGEEALISIAVKDFEHFKGVLGGGLPEIFQSLRLHTANKDLAKGALCLLTNLMQRRSFIAPRVADLAGSCELLMVVLWTHLNDRDVRRRVLTCARLIRKAVPSSVDNLANAWTAQQRAYEEQQQQNAEQGLPTPKVPNDIKRFGALAYIHRYALTGGQRPIMEAVAPLRDHTRDKEIVTVGINAIMRGTEFMMKDRFKALSEESTFPAAMNRILLLHPEPAIVLLSLQLVTGILQEAGAQKSNYNTEEYAGTAAMALSTLFEVTVEWTCQTWDAMLVATEVVGRIEGGVEILDRYEILECIEDDWDNLTDSDEETARMVIKQFQEETKRVIALLT